MIEKFNKLARMLESCGFECREVKEFSCYVFEKNGCRVSLQDEYMRISSGNLDIRVPESKLCFVKFMMNGCNDVVFVFDNGFFARIEEN